jgi:hypothetical protein
MKSEHAANIALSERTTWAVGANFHTVRAARKPRGFWARFFNL